MSKSESVNKNNASEHSSRREFIQRTLKMTTGAYVSMNILEQFAGPEMGKGGMPLYAASGRVIHGTGDDGHARDHDLKDRPQRDH